MRLLKRVEIDVMEEFCDYLRQELRRSPKTIESYRLQIDLLVRQLDKDATEISVKDLRHGVKRDESLSLGTRNLRLSAFKELHRWAGADELPWYNPNILAVRRIPLPRRMPRAPLKMQDAARLLAIAETPHEVRVVYFGLYAGTRIGESALMTKDNIHGDSMTFIGKGNKERTVPIHPELKAKLPWIMGQQPASVAVLTSVFSRLRDRHHIVDANGKPATAHSLRRTCADFMYNRGDIPREQVKAILGHGAEVTDLYAAPSQRKLKEAIYAINYSRGEPVQLTLW